MSQILPAYTDGLEAYISELRSEIVALKVENARLKREDFSHERIQNDTLKLQNRVLYEKMIEAQAYAEQLREAIFQFRNEPILGRATSVRRTSGYAAIEHAVFDLPHDTSALDDYVSEKVKEATAGHVEDIRFKDKEIEKLRRIKMSRFSNEDCWIYQGDGEDHLESLSCPVVVYPHVLMDLTRQRDLAIDALEWALSNINCEPFEWSDEENADAHKAAIEVMSAIKEINTI